MNVKDIWFPHELAICFAAVLLCCFASMVDTREEASFSAVATYQI